MNTGGNSNCPTSQAGTTAKPDRQAPGSCFNLPRTGLTLALLMVLSPLAVPMPWIPVPVTLQTFVLFAICPLLSCREVLAVLITYLLAGGLGFPVFAGGTGGAVVLAGPTGGFLASFPFAGLIISWFSGPLSRSGSPFHSRRPGFHGSPLAGYGLAILVIYIMGLVWLSMNLGKEIRGLLPGMVPFLVLDILKALGAWHLVKRIRSADRGMETV